VVAENLELRLHIAGELGILRLLRLRLLCGRGLVSGCWQLLFKLRWRRELDDAVLSESAMVILISRDEYNPSHGRA
jgi:hypothetical protein